MQFEKVKCNTCDSLVLPSTFEKCDGLCMQCFMEGNEGYRPSELSSLKERGLRSYFERWNEFKDKSIPSTDNVDAVKKLNHYIPVICASISGFLRFGGDSFDGMKNIDLIVELKCCCESKLNQYIQELEAFNQELISATKT